MMSSLIFESVINMLNLTNAIERSWSEKHFKLIPYNPENKPSVKALFFGLIFGGGLFSGGLIFGMKFASEKRMGLLSRGVFLQQ